MADLTEPAPLRRVVGPSPGLARRADVGEQSIPARLCLRERLPPCRHDPATFVARWDENDPGLVFLGPDRTLV